MAILHSIPYFSNSKEHISLFYKMTHFFFKLSTYNHFIYWFIFVFWGPHPQNMEVPRLGVKSELQLPAYATATATQDPSCICNLPHCSQQCCILNPVREARVEPTSTWVLVGFVSAVPQWELTLINISVFMPVPCYFDNCSFVVLSEIRDPDSSIYIFFFNIALAISFQSSVHFSIPLYSKFSKWLPIYIFT